MTKLYETHTSAYSTKSVVSQKLRKCIAEKKPLRFAFLDIDFTLSAKKDVLEKTKESLEKKGYCIVLVTARTEEMLMDEVAYTISKKNGFSRPIPHLRFIDGTYTYEDPRHFLPHFVNPDIIIGSTGTTILVRQIDGGYKRDALYEKKFCHDRIWRSRALSLLNDIAKNHPGLFSLSPVEYMENYLSGTTNVAPPDRRIQLLFKSMLSRDIFLRELKKRTSKKLPLRVIDDSHPQKGKYTMYIVPFGMHKGQAVDHVVSQIVRALQIAKSAVETLIAGDSYADLAMLLYGAMGTRATVVVVGGSRISPLFKTTKLNKKIKKYPTRRYIVGDQISPTRIGPETILDVLRSRVS